jgi:MYXO-CTERM domain-containing protein
MSIRAVVASCAFALSQSVFAGVPAPWVSPDNGFGTATMPPTGAKYECVNDVWQIVDGLPPGSTINIDAKWGDFFSVTESAGGGLGGTTSSYAGMLEFPMVGTGAFAGFNRFIVIPLPNPAGNIIDMAARTAFAPVQSFDSALMRMQGQIVGDPDFDLLRVTAGYDFGLPSPGHTTLTDIGGGQWNVDSFFDITYRIDFVGAPGGALAGMSGSTTATIRMQLGVPAPGALPLLGAAGLVLTRRRRSA